MSSSSDDLSSPSWQPLPLHRHLSTVGIGPVFVHPPSHYDLPPAVNSKVDSEDNTADGNGEVVENKSPFKPPLVTTTWEITGDIKSTPQDFVVREIGWCPSSTQQDTDQNDTGDRSFMNKYYRRKGWRRGIAGLMQSDSATKADEGIDVTDDCREYNDDVSATNTIDEEGKCTTTQPAEEKAHVTNHDEPTLKRKRASSPMEVNDTGAEETTKPALLDAPRSIPSKSNIDISQSPDKILRQVLIQCYDSSHTNINSASEYADNIMEQISTLQAKTLQMLKDNSTNIACASDKQQETADENRMKLSTTAISDIDSEPVHDDTDSVWISTSNLFQDDANKGSWKLLHETVRNIYPLLKTENASHLPHTKANDQNEYDTTKKNTKNAWVCVIVDDCFFSLIPYLLHPRDDLLQLYTFRSLGPVKSATTEAGSRSNQTNNRKKNRWKKGKRGGQSNNREEDGSQNSQDINNEGKVLLHLKPDLPRTERRNIHQMITGKNRKSDFETSTRNDVRISSSSNDGLDDTTSEQITTAIVIQWSKMAIQNLYKKRKREEANFNTKSENNCATSNSSPQKRSQSDIKALFCTLQKDQIEHQVAIQSLTQALKCRPGDIGLAGIKDMKAITSQFCTLRNVDIKRAQRPILDKRVKLSNFVPVANFLLDRGRLIGNQFEIILRNLRQVERTEEDNGPSSWKERFVPVRSSHINAMVDRVTKHGFINYYGEQRVGDAGHKQFVGVRSFDVGRALLQQNFSLAVDLIMEGRSTHVYNPTQEEVNTRQTWKTTKDARATLKQFPKSRNIMVRERDLMRGLLRYDDPLEAVRTVPHNTRTFWIHAYQSFVWNKIATERIKNYGVEPIEGDLYQQDDESDVSVVTEPSKVSISQVVLPLPGYTVQYPTNTIGDLYKQILANDGVQLSIKNDVEEASAKGSYRKLIQYAGNLKWESIIDKEINGIKGDSSSELDSVVEAARFTFELDSGCYATMLFRELMLTTMARGDGRC